MRTDGDAAHLVERDRVLLVQRLPVLQVEDDVLCAQSNQKRKVSTRIGADACWQTLRDALNAAVQQKATARRQESSTIQENVGRTEVLSEARGDKP